MLIIYEYECLIKNISLLFMSVNELTDIQAM